jgi:hypothetical protein
MSSQRATFEFHVLRSKNWNVKDIFKDEATAQKAAEAELKKHTTEGVRIIRIWKRADGQEVEKVILERMSQAKPIRDVRIVPIETAPYCSGEADILSPVGMRTLGALFRKYLDEAQLTPMEVLHCEREYKRIWDTENILVSGVDRVALIQTRNVPDLDLKTRTDELYRMVEAIGFRAKRTARKRYLQETVTTTLGAVWDECAMRPEDELDVEFSTNLVLARDLLSQGSLMSKLVRISDLLAKEPSADARRLLDGAAAQIFASPVIFQDAIGPKPNLAEALLTVIDVLEGGERGFDRGLPASELFLNGIRDNSLPLVRDELFSRMVSMVGGHNPMSRNEPRNETVEFGKVANRLVIGDRVIGDSEVALALLSRACQFVTEGGAIGRKRGLEWLLRVLKTVPQRIQILKVLDKALEPEPEIRLAAFTLLRSIITSTRSAITFAPGCRDMIAPMRNVRSLYDWLLSHCPPKTAAPLLEHLDQLVAKYVEEKQIIERVDRPDLKLAERATMLLGFVLSGVLTDGKAMDMARCRILEHLKRPDFVAAFADCYPEPQVQEQKLREFYSMLAKAGFSVNGS